LLSPIQGPFLLAKSCGTPNTKQWRKKRFKEGISPNRGERDSPKPYSSKRADSQRVAKGLREAFGNWDTT